MRTQVAIVGAGPAGTLLAVLLRQAGIESIVLERQSRAHVLERIRAGVLEPGTVDVLRQAGVAERLEAEGRLHDTINIGRRDGSLISIDTHALVGRRTVAYGQTKIQEDLYAAADARGVAIVDEVAGVELHDVTTVPWISFQRDRSIERIDCDWIAGCDGFHGVSRPTIPRAERREFEKVYPFGWLGVLCETPPLPIIMYATSERGFALCSQRGPRLSRYYVQCPIDDSVDDWPDARFWTELLARVPDAVAPQITPGASIEKSIAPLRSFVSEPMRFGRLLLVGDATHIVPPTGAKGLNLAVSDAFYLARALRLHYHAGDDCGLDTYSAMALRRVWSAVRFSWWLTVLLHRFPQQSDFDRRAQSEELRYLATSVHAQRSMAEQFVGLPLEELDQSKE